MTATAICKKLILLLVSGSDTGFHSFQMAGMTSPLKIVAAIGLALGGVFGLAGTLVSEPNLRSTFWGIDGVGLVVAAAILTLKFFRSGDDAVAAGFLVFAIGEGVMLSGTAQSLEAMVPSFAAGTALWAAALLLTGIPKVFAVWIRVVSVAGAILFAATSARILWGERILPTAFPLPSLGYPLLVLAFLGWIWTLMREN